MRRAEIEADEGEGFLKICHGPPRCYDMTGKGCEFCYVVPPGDLRTTEQIIEDMKKQQ